MQLRKLEAKCVLNGFRDSGEGGRFAKRPYRFVGFTPTLWCLAACWLCPGRRG